MSLLRVAKNLETASGEKIITNGKLGFLSLFFKDGVIWPKNDHWLLLFNV